MKLYKFAVPVIKIIQKTKSNTVIIESGIVKNNHAIKAEIIIWINKRNLDERVKRSSRKPINPAVPAIKVKDISFITKTPIIKKTIHIPIPPARGVGNEWELRPLGLSIKAMPGPNFDMRAAQKVLKKKDRKAGSKIGRRWWVVPATDITLNS